jgi:hypothetical protein
MMSLYEFALSGNCHKVRLMLSLLGLDYRSIAVNGGQRQHKSAGSRYFCESLFLASQPNQAAKITRPLMPPAAPIRPRRLVSTQQGVETLALA